MQCKEHGQEDGADDLQQRAVVVRRVAVVGRLEGLLDLVAVLDVLLGEAGDVLGGEGLLHQQGVELIHLVLHFVQANEVGERGKEC